MGDYSFVRRSVVAFEFEIGGREPAQGGVAALAAMEGFDEVEGLGLGLSVGGEMGFLPALGRVGGGLELLGIDEGLDHRDGVAAAGLPVRAETIERSREQARADGFDPTEVVVLLERRLEPALIRRPGQGDDPDVLQRDRGLRDRLFSPGDSALHASARKKSKRVCSAQSTQTPSFLAQTAFSCRHAVRRGPSAGWSTPVAPRRALPRILEGTKPGWGANHAVADTPSCRCRIQRECQGIRPPRESS